ncbi:polysaccharide lyase family protein [Paenibacillus tyrfis]|uniref:polysaccharide lyase family protein n=1 Tax=Paenibacillus tyrfis TaxID=1501230 RepID=UPI000B596387|nr:polysaccharide lyase family protein [Paenibacillus tyrfis]
MLKKAGIMLILAGLLLLSGFTLQWPEQDPRIWRIGVEDDSKQEFAANLTADKLQYQVKQGTSQTVWSDFPAGLDASITRNLSIHYSLSKVPEHGVNFKVRVLSASKAVPQMSVFSNGTLSGMIQITGIGEKSPYKYKKLYELYIPKEQLKQGQNELKLGAERCLYCSDKEDPQLYWSWDYLELESLTEPANEPVHGRYIQMGTGVASNDYYFDTAATRHLPYVLKWLGIAYSGNIVRAGCFSNVGNSCSDMKNYYAALKEYNTGAVALYLYTKNITLDPDGGLPADARAKLTDFLKQYGRYIQYYEVDNEPGLFERSKAVNVAVAQWLSEHRSIYSPHLQIVSPGWSYKSTGGEPYGWERDSVQRKELEDLTDLTNGHAYGTSYADNEGGSFVENLRTLGSDEDGLPKKMLNTEVGTTNTHLDPPAYGAGQKQAAVFDRILRAHIGFSDIFIQHAAFYKNYELFRQDFDFKSHDPATTRSYSFPGNQDSRVKIFRRLALAYATHGKPLSFEIVNRSETNDKKVYVRAVDTSYLAPLPGSGATSDKLLVNFVNFEDSPQSVRVRVRMPLKGDYHGERIGPGETYRDAVQQVQVKASPWAEFQVNLPAGDSVQYILSRKPGD